MMGRTKQFCRGFAHKENGSMTIEFVLGVPLIFTLFMTSVEMSVYSMRQMWLDRGLDVTIRQVRLSTGDPDTHAELKAMICDQAGFLPDCDSTLRLEMIPVDVRSFAGFGATADCVDTSQPVTPLRNFTNGSEHELMLLRACYMFKPVFASTGLGKEFTKDGSGRVKMVSYSAFVQEPA